MARILPHIWDRRLWASLKAVDNTQTAFADWPGVALPSFRVFCCCPFLLSDSCLTLILRETSQRMLGTFFLYFLRSSVRPVKLVRILLAMFSFRICCDSCWQDVSHSICTSHSTVDFRCLWAARNERLKVFLCYHSKALSRSVFPAFFEGSMPLRNMIICCKRTRKLCNVSTVVISGFDEPEIVVLALTEVTVEVGRVISA